MPAESLFFEDKNARFHCLRFGDAARPLLIIFHGFADKADLFLNLESAIGEHFDVIAVDLPYHGRTEWHRRGYKPRHIIRLVEQICAYVGKEGFSLMAHSMGGFIALKLYTLLPQRVEGLILLAPGGVYKALPFNRWLFARPIRRFLQATVGLGLIQRIIRGAAKMRLLHRSFSEFVQQHFEKKHRQERMFNSWSSLYYFNVQHERIHRRLLRYGTPICFFYGTKDKITPVSAAQKMMQGIPQAEIHTVEDTHFFIREPLNSALAAWLKVKSEK